MEDNIKNGNAICRIGRLFHSEISDIQREMYKNNGFISSEKITNLIVKHKKYWVVLKQDVVNASKEEIKNANK